MRVVFLGSPDFAIESLRALIESHHEVLAVVTQPDAEAGRGHKVLPCAVKEFAAHAGLRVLSYEKISRDGLDDLKLLAPDIMITCAYGQILSQAIIDIPRFGIINVHGSLLPKYRGAAPIQTAVIDGETETGVTIMQTEAGLDTGDILKVGRMEIGENETSGELMARLSGLGAKLLLETLDDFEKGTITRTRQVSNDATFTTKLTKLNCSINFNKTAKQVHNLVRGANPDPIARTSLNGEAVKIYETRVRPDIASTADKAGTIIAPTSAKAGVFVQCGFGVIEIVKMQLPNGKVVDAKALVGGRKLSTGQVFGEFASTKVE